jgi:hypothetical protein
MPSSIPLKSFRAVDRRQHRFAFRASSCLLNATLLISDVPGIARSAISRSHVPDLVEVAPARVNAVPSKSDCIGSISRPDCNSGTA